MGEEIGTGKNGCVICDIFDMIKTSKLKSVDNDTTLINAVKFDV